MATGGQKEIGYNLANVGTLTLGHADLDPRGIIVSREMLMITDFNTHKVHVYRRHDGMLLSTSDQLEADPNGMCFINDREICLALDNGKIEFMSVDNTGQINRGKKFNLQTTFNECHGVGRFRDKVVVCGVINTTICWCIASLEDGHVDDVHNICEGWLSFLTIKDTMIYISCGTDSHDSHCVYGCNIMNPRQQPFVYKHEGWWSPRGITVDDKGFLFLCDYKSIHHLTNQCQIVTKYMEGIPRNPMAIFWNATAIFWDNGILYVTSNNSNVIHRYKLLYPHQQGLPPEILQMDIHSQQLFQDALKAGKEKVYNIRLMIVGHLGVGKTTLTKRILGEEIFEGSPHVSTVGIEVHSGCCKIDHETKKWSVEKIESRFSETDQRLVNIIHEHVENTKREESFGGLKSDMPVETQNIIKTDETKTDRKSAHDSDEPRSSQIKSLKVQSSSSEKTVKEDIVAQSDFHRFVARNRSIKYSGKPVSYVTILDFAGQFLFYTTHQAFMSWRTLYLLVTDITMSLDDLVKGDMCHMDLNRIKEYRIQDYVVYWLNSVYSYVQQETGNKGQSQEKEANYPPVILVATHMDKVPEEMRKRQKQEYFDHVGRILKDRPLRFLVKGNFAISNFGQDADIDALRDRIFELAQKQGYWGEEIPATWLALEQKLMDLKRTGKSIVEYTDVLTINQSSDVKIEKPEELEVFLRFQHDLGNIVFYSTEKLRNKIVLDPNWLIDGVKIMMSPSENLMVDHPNILPQWYDFKDTGRLTESLIGCLWSEGQHEKLHHNQEHLLEVMEKLSIIAKPVEKEDTVQNQEKYYWVPCMIHKNAPDHVKNPEPRKDVTRTSTLCFMSKTKFIHVGVFHRLVASCLSKWPAAKEGKEYRLYSGCCVFKVEDCHTLLLSLSDFVILATIFVYSSEVKDLDKTLCISIKEFIYSTLFLIAACICPNLEFDVCVKCEKSSLHTTEGLLEISGKKKRICDCTEPAHGVNLDDLIKFWEQQPEIEQREMSGSEQDQEDTPITQEHINHARLCNALTTVCANALRKILLTNVPAPHTDIYQAILASQAKLKKLNKDQHQLVFPDPQSHYTGKVEEFDISLLYAMIRNVSSVTAPSNSWGNPPADQPRDTTLGASVERIRTYRNSISGHSVDGTISQQEFDDYWTKIDSVLHDIENVIGNHGYLEDLEKRKNQVITPQEARELRKTFLEYKKQTEATAADIQSALETALSAAKKLKRC